MTYLDLDDAPACQPIRPPRGEGMRAGVYRRFKRADVAFRQRYRQAGVWWLPGMSR